MVTIYTKTDFDPKGISIYLSKGKYKSSYLKNKDFIDGAGNSRISSYKVDSDIKASFYTTPDYSGNPYITRTGPVNVSYANNDSYKSIIVCSSTVSTCDKNTNTETFENKSSICSDKNTNNYIFVLLIIISFFYMCKK